MEINFDNNKIKKIEYELNERKTATFIFKDGNLADVNVKELSMEEPDYQPFSVMEDYQPGAKYASDIIMKYLKENRLKKGEHPFSRKEKELHDYKPITCLDNNTQTTLESSRKKEWFDSVKEKPSNPSKTGNALVTDAKSVETADLREESNEVPYKPAKKTKF